MPIHINFIDATSDPHAVVDAYFGTPALAQLLQENNLDLTTLLPASEAAVAFTDQDTVISTLKSLETRLKPVATVAEGETITKSEADMSPDETESLLTNVHTMTMKNNETYQTFAAVSSGSVLPPVGFPDLHELITSLQTARNEAHQIQVSYE